MRLPGEIAARLRAGHPFVFREALGNRPLREAAGDVLELVDEAGEFVARGLYEPDAIVAVRVVTRDPNELVPPTDRGWIERRLRAAARLREALLPSLSDGGMTAYRAFHGEGDGLPGVSIDRYGQYAVVHLFSSAFEPLREALYDAIEEIYKPAAIYEQRRYRPQTGEGPRAPAALVRGSAAPVEVEVAEYGLKFAVDVTAPLGTGLFPDLREGRRAIGERAKGRRMLNLFSYTGAFSVWGAHGGAKEVVSVDLAAKAHARARRNLALNGLDEKRHEFVAGDAFPVLAQMADRKRRFDLVVVDPPSFAQAKGRVFSAQRDYRDLVEQVFTVCDPGALVACVSNTIKMSVEELDRAIGEAAYRAGREVRVVERRGLPADFPIAAGFADGHYLKFFLCVVD